MNSILLADDIKDVFGKISPPVKGMPSDPQVGLNKIISLGIRSFITLSAVFLLLYMLWGAFDWITSGGAKEKIVKAQNKIVNALIGMILVVVVLVIFRLITSDILGIMPNGIIVLPTLK